jgi:AraC-like DNA-binding protein
MWVPLPREAVEKVASLVGNTSPDESTSKRLTRAFLVKEGSRFHIDSKQRMIGNSLVSLITAGPYRYEGASTRPPETLQVGFVINGTLSIQKAGGSLETFCAGEAFAIADWRRVALESPGPSRVLSLRLGLHRLRDLGLKFGSEHARFDGSAVQASPVRLFALALLDGSWKPNPFGVASQMVERVLDELVIGMFLDAVSTASDTSDLQAILRARAIHFIGAEHHHAELTPTTVAAHLGVSVRHLQRAFQGERMSTTQLILHHRFTSAALILRGLSTRNLTMEEVANRVGFSSTFELRAAFKSQMGILPSAFRINAQPKPPAELNASSPVPLRAVVTNNATTIRIAGVS